MWGLNKSVKNKRITFNTWDWDNPLGQVWTCLGALGWAINMRPSYPHRIHNPLCRDSVIVVGQLLQRAHQQALTGKVESIVWRWISNQDYSLVHRSHIFRLTHSKLNSLVSSRGHLYRESVITSSKLNSLGLSIGHLCKGVIEITWSKITQRRGR